MIADEWARLARASRLYRLGATAATISVGMLAKIYITVFNRTLFLNKNGLRNVLALRRSNPRPLITVSNHRSCLDDPFFVGALLPPIDLARRDQMRWGLGAEDVMFKSKLHYAFFNSGKILPVVRGNGVYQPVMDFLLEMLNKNQWVHIFPEGKVLENKSIARLKWGVSRLIMECKRVPLVLPIFLEGMERILPNHKPYIPRMGKTVAIVVGECMEFRDTILSLQSSGKSTRTIRSIIAERIQSELNRLGSMCPKTEDAACPKEERPSTAGETKKMAYKAYISTQENT